MSAIRIAIVAGEPSGDVLGGQLITELRKRFPDIEVEGVVGPLMLEAGCTQLYGMEDLALMGFVEPLMNLRRLFKMRKWLSRYFIENPPDVFIGIDSPDFNLGLEKILRAAGITTVHYVSPSVWAWRQGRIKIIKQATDLMLTLFPFEEKFYTKNNMPVKYIGHPAADLIPMTEDQSSARDKLKIPEKSKLIAIMPGSRNSEIKRMTSVYLKAIRMCAQQIRSLKFVFAVLYEGHAQYIEILAKKLAPNADIECVVADQHTVMAAADCALVTSGTATLELMLHKKPMLVAYKTNWVTYQIVKALIKIKYIALPNLIANKPLVTELIQASANPREIAKNLLKLIEDKTLRDSQIKVFIEQHKQLQQNANMQAVTAISELIGANSRG